MGEGHGMNHRRYAKGGGAWAEALGVYKRGRGIM